MTNNTATTTNTATADCRYCGRTIVNDPTYGWIDPEATGDDSVWRETCDEHDTFIAEHAPATGRGPWIITNSGGGILEQFATESERDDELSEYADGAEPAYLSDPA